MRKGLKVDVAAEGTLGGRHLVADPCYVLGGDKGWRRIVNLLYEGQGEVENNWLLVDGHLVYIWGTSSGDGLYPVYLNGARIGEVSVDSGLLAFMPMGLVDGMDLGESSENIGVEVDLDGVEPDSVNGDASAGKVEVFTSQDDPYARADAESESDRERMSREDEGGEDDLCGEMAEWNKEDLA